MPEVKLLTSITLSRWREGNRGKMNDFYHSDPRQSKRNPRNRFCFHLSIVNHIEPHALGQGYRVAQWPQHGTNILTALPNHLSEGYPTDDW